ncbi:MAG: amidohydrolase [Chitinophagaceae bacterium]|nr:amidohydrolase [Chitinophagaceae bacterium]
MKKLKWLFWVFAVLSCKSKMQVDLIVHNGTVYSVDSLFTIAQAFAVKDGKIEDVGSNDQILDHYTADSVLNAQQQTIYPGFIDGHAHFYGYAMSLQEVNLVGTKSWDECIARIQAFAEKQRVQAGEWIVGNGWDQNDWVDKVFPGKELLDKNFPQNPVLLSRIDGHAAIANEAALNKAHIKSGDTVQGGLIETKNKKLTGILIDNAIARVSAMIPEPAEDSLEDVFLLAERNCFAVGLTGITDCGLVKKQVDFLERLQRENKLRMRLTIMLSDDPGNYAHYLRKGPYTAERIHIAGFKLFADGALGSRGACLLQPYNDKPGWSGFLLDSVSHYTKALRQILQLNFQACTHAIGDSANRMILEQYAALLSRGNDRRWRVEHAQVVDSGDVHFFKEYNIIPSVQPTHATSDMYWAGDRLGGERIKNAYAFKRLLQQNNWIVLGTDFPVEDISPFKTFYAAVVRKDASGYPEGGFEPRNALGREEALRGMTIWAAKGNFEEQEKGSIEKGKTADFVITDTDIMQCDPLQILRTQVTATYVNGEKFFSR